MEIKRLTQYCGPTDTSKAWCGARERARGGDETTSHERLLMKFFHLCHFMIISLIGAFVCYRDMKLYCIALVSNTCIFPV